MKPHQEKESNEELDLDLETLVFMQLCNWLELKGPSLQNYEEILSVAPRRGQLQSKVWRRLEDGELVVLKTFNKLSLKTIQRAIINEIIVPYVTDSEYILKPSDFFIQDEVCKFLILVYLFMNFYFYVGVMLGMG
jgi:hypothetical protein